jgi:hypothetical protein
MTNFIEIQHDEWIAAAPDVVRAHYGDLGHRQVARVHPRERLRQLEPGPTGPRFERLVRSGWRVVRDVFERSHQPDGSVVDRCVAGANWGRTITARFFRGNEGSRIGTLLELTVTQPLRPLVGRLVGGWIRRRIERELHEYAADNKADVERGYKQGARLRVA